MLPTYSADTFGVCSALYELGGMTVMHDASGCNSTYSTHDEPRWYDMDSLVFISALTEMEAIMGDDGKVLGDMLAAVTELHPKFAALAGTPIPMMTGCDIPAITRQLEEKSGIPCFGFQTNGMRSYLCGASEALEAVARRLVEPQTNMRPGTLNILGATPLDFSINGSVEAMVERLQKSGWHILSTWAMGSSLEEIRRAGEAQVNLVVSGVGMKAAKVLEERFGTPYVVGTPIGELFTRRIVRQLGRSARDGKSRMAISGARVPADRTVCIVGESVISRSLAGAFLMECGFVPRVVCPLENLPELAGVMSSEDVYAMEEEEIKEALREAKTVIADPLYGPVLPKDCWLVPFPHEAFSGRMFRTEIPNLIKLNVADWAVQSNKKEGSL